MKFQSILNYDYTKHKGENNISPSLTVPDATMNIREIVKRYAQGIPMNGKEPIFEGEELLPDIKYMDLADRQGYAQAYQSELNELKQKNQQNTKPISQD